MSTLKLTCNLNDKTWTVEKTNSGNEYELLFAFSNGEDVVEFKNLTFGFDLSSDGENIESVSLPPQGIFYKKTDQEFIDRKNITLEEDKLYVLFLWANNGGDNITKIYPIEGTKPPKPFSSWIWSEGKWEAPTTKPNDGKFYEWLESSQQWNEVSAGANIA
jgi:hypothetical protein